MPVFYKLNRKSALWANLCRVWTSAIAWFLLSASPQSLYPQTGQIKFKNISIEDGLSQNFVQHIYRDSKGFMWFGTRDGLNRYDGYKIITFRHNPRDAKSISHNTINDIVEDKAGNLFIATNNGIDKFDRTSRSFKRCLWPGGPLKVSDLIMDKNGLIWLGTINAGFMSLNPANGKFVPYLQKEAKANDVHKIFEYKDGIFWIANKAGLDQIDVRTSKIARFSTNASDPKCLPGNTIRDIYRDSKGTIWLSVYRVGLARYNEKDNSFTNFKYNSNVNDGITDPLIWVISEAADGRLWLGTENTGVCVFDPKTKKSVAYQPNISDRFSLSHQWVRAIYKDKLGDMWVGTKAGGVDLLSKDREKFRHVTESTSRDGLNNKFVLSIIEDSKKRLWVATEGGGLNVYDPRKNVFSYLKHGPAGNCISSNIVYAIADIGNNKLAIGHAEDRGLDIINLQTGTVANYPSDKNTNDPDRISGRIVSCILKDAAGQLWIGTLGGGISILNLTTKRYRKFKRLTELNQRQAAGELLSNVILSIYQDKNSRIWVGTEFGSNLFNEATGQFTNVKLSDTEDPNVNCIWESADGEMWFGTSQGLIRMPKKGRQVAYTEANGLPGNVIKSMLADRHGNLWLGTNRGLSKLTLTSGKFTNYNVSDGLQSNEFNSGAAYVSKDGTMYFGGLNGYNSFHPDSMSLNQNPPPVALTNFASLNKGGTMNEQVLPWKTDINEIKEVVLDHKQAAFFSFEFAALDYLASERNTYAYKLDGFDRDWHYVGEKREATYTNIPAGDYVFTVKATNNDRVWNTQGKSVRIRITPPFWLTGWAYFVYAMALSGLLYVIFIQIRYREQLKNRMLYQKHTSEKMQELNQIKLNFFTNISHELRTPLSLIIDPLRKIVKDEMPREQLQKYSTLAYDNARRLKDLVNQLLDLWKMEIGSISLEASRVNVPDAVKNVFESFCLKASERNIDYTIELPARGFDAWIDPDKFQKILLNLISNAFKYTPDEGKIKLSVLLREKGQDASETDRFEIHVTDTGVGISPEHQEQIFKPFYQVSGSARYEDDSSGIGLSYVRELVLLHHGEIKVKSEKSGGSEFIVSIPVGEGELASENPVLATGKNRAEIENSAESAIEYPESPKEKRLILIVEDNRELGSYIVQELAKQYQVEQASNGLEGLDKARVIIPDLVVSDVMMPELDGFQLCNKLKSDERTSHIPVVLLTAKQSDENKKEGYAVGADAYISKPFNTDLLVARIDNILESRKRLRQLFSMKGMEAFGIQETFDLDKEFIRKAISVVDEHIADPGFQIDDLAFALKLSRRQLYRKLKAVTNQTAHDFIMKIRLQKSAKLLLAREYTIAEIAYKVGFSEPANFSRTFTKEFKLSPRKYLAEKASPSKIG